MEPAPRYISTRGQASGVSFQQALLTGLAPDGGLFIPDGIPTLEPSDWKEPDRFSELALRVLSRWLKDEAPREALRMILDDATERELADESRPVNIRSVERLRHVCHWHDSRRSSL